MPTTSRYATRRRAHLARLSVLAVGVGSLLGGFTVLAGNGTAGASGNLYVSSYGANTGNCTNANAPCLTLTYAYGQAGSGDTIHVAGGTFAGPPDITKSINIVGTSSDGSLDVVTTTISGRHSIGAGVIDICCSSITVNISDVVVTGGISDGIINYTGHLTLTNVNLADNESNGYDGGGIYNGDNLVYNGGTVSGNTTTGGGVGGGFDNDGTAKLINVTFTHNTVSGTGGEGGAIFNFLGTVHLTGTDPIHNNSAADQGGGVFTCPAATTTVGPGVSDTANTPNDTSSDDTQSACV
jgi:hypothetical protein